MIRALVWLLAAVVAGPLTAAWGADKEAERASGDDRTDSKLKIMREAIEGLQISAKRTDSEAVPKFSARPLLRYNDGTRGNQGISDATVWRLGERGRPKAIATMEIYPVNQSITLLQYEFVSLTSDKLELQNRLGVRWLPHSTELSMTKFKEVPPPAATPKARLVQMRALARRFAAHEELRNGEKIELRLLSQPIDRYDDPAAGILDGAVFVFANGTNPEIGLLLECSKEQWSFGFCRLAAARLLAQFDGESVLESDVESMGQVDAPYLATGHEISLPAEQ